MAATIPPPGEIQCVECGTVRPAPLTKKGSPRIPRGWKEIAGHVYCQKCKLARYALRAVSIPVARCGWDKVMPLLRQSWRESIQCANWLLTQYYQHDTLAGDLSAKLPKWATPYLYPEARVKFPGIEPTGLVSLINTISAKYRAARFDLWRNAASLPVQRNLPLPINAQSWKLSGHGHEWAFSFRLGGEWYELTLRGGREFYRQHAALTQIASGEMESGEAALYQHGASLILKLPGWYPRAHARQAEHIIKARTAIDAFLIATDGAAIWRLNADQVTRWIVGANAQQQRLREDLKAERRFPKAMRQGIVDRMSRLSERRGDQLASWTHEAAAQLVNWTRRSHASKLIWDDSYDSMLPSFPWFIFAEKIQQKCELAGIEFVRASEGVTLKTPQPLVKSGSD